MDTKIKYIALQELESTFRKKLIVIKIFHHTLFHPLRNIIFKNPFLAFTFVLKVPVANFKVLGLVVTEIT